MTREELETKVREIIARQVDLPLERVELDDSMVYDLGCDSLSMVELMLEAEDTFEIDIPDEATNAVDTVKDAVDLMERLTKAKAS